MDATQKYHTLFNSLEPMCRLGPGLDIKHGFLKDIERTIKTNDSNKGQERKSAQRKKNRRPSMLLYSVPDVIRARDLVELAQLDQRQEVVQCATDPSLGKPLCKSLSDTCTSIVKLNEHLTHAERSTSDCFDKLCHNSYISSASSESESPPHRGATVGYELRQVPGYTDLTATRLSGCVRAEAGDWSASGSSMKTLLEPSSSEISRNAPADQSRSSQSSRRDLTDHRRMPCILGFNLRDVGLDKCIEEEAKQFILKALQEGHRSDLGKVIVERAWKHTGCHQMAARLCDHIGQNETERDNSSVFWNGVVGTCREVFEKLVAGSEGEGSKSWRSYVAFVSALYTGRYNPSRSQPLRKMAPLLFGVLAELLNPPSIEDVEQVSLLSRMFCDCGRDLEAADVVAMQELVDVAKDAFLKEKNNIKIRTQLMLMVETHASNWQLSEAAKKFYSTRH